jgi:hypothetical protein
MSDARGLSEISAPAGADISTGPAVAHDPMAGRTTGRSGWSGVCDEERLPSVVLLGPRVGEEAEPAVPVGDAVVDVQADGAGVEVATGATGTACSSATAPAGV